MSSSNPDEVKAAAKAIFVTYTEANIIAKAIEQIIPQRRNLEIVLSSLQYRLSSYGKDRRSIIKAILPVLASDRITVSWQIKLAVASLNWDELEEFLINLNRRDELHSDALVVAENAILHTYHRSDIDRLQDLERNLVASGDEKLRRLALSALIAQTKSKLGWNRERVARLLTYQQDSSTLVAAAAQFIFPPDNIIAEDY